MTQPNQSNAALNPKKQLLELYERIIENIYVYKQAEDLSKEELLQEIELIVNNLPIEEVPTVIQNLYTILEKVKLPS